MRTARALTVSPSMRCAGVGAWSWGGMPGLGGCMVPGGGGDAWSWGVCMVGGCVVSQHALRQTPSPCEQNDKQL